MKNLLYRDICDPRRVYYSIASDLPRHERSKMFVDGIKGLGNIAVFSQKGNKVRFLFKRGLG